MSVGASRKEGMSFKNIQEIKLARFGDDWMLEMKEEEEDFKMTPDCWLGGKTQEPSVKSESQNCGNG